jgi:hypothetical protein
MRDGSEEEVYIRIDFHLILISFSFVLKESIFSCLNKCILMGGYINRFGVLGTLHRQN